MDNLEYELMKIYKNDQSDVNMDNMTEDELIEIVKNNPYKLYHIKNQTEKICLEAVKQNGILLIAVKNQTDEICLEAVKECGIALQNVINQNNSIVLEAVKEFGWALQYVKEQTNEICLEAVKECGCALQYVKEQTNEICLEAVKEDGDALKYVKEQNDFIVLEAIKQQIQFITYLNIKIKSINEFLKINPYIIYFLRDCDSYDYLCIFRYLLTMNKTYEKINFNILPIHTIGHFLKNHTIDNSFITIFINFLIEQQQYNVLQTIRMEQPFYNNIKK